MKKSAFWIPALILVTGPVFAEKVYVDYDGSYDAKSARTFAWAETSKTSIAKTDPLLHSRILNGIEYYLTLAGLHETDSDPDLRVTYHTSSKKEVSVDTSLHGYGYPGGWGYYHRYPAYGYVDATSTVRTYQRGTLIVDVWDAASNKLVWRGTAADIGVTDNPTKMEKRVDKALKKMVNKWRKYEEQNSK